MVEALIVRIKYLHRDRCFAMEQRKRLDLALGAYLRMRLGWWIGLDEKDRKRIAIDAQILANDPKSQDQMVIGTRDARAPFEVLEKAALREMERLAKQLPIWGAFGESIRGFGAASLAVIVAEAGDISDYASDAKLWKRMGLAPNQGRVPAGLSKEARRQAWIDRGYSPRRRSRMWNIGDTLIKGNRDGKYRACYLARKAQEHARDPEMSKMHAHRRAQRYMEKRLLRDLWRAWRRTGKRLATRPIFEASSASSSETPTESRARRSITTMPEKAILTLAAASIQDQPT